MSKEPDLYSKWLGAEKLETNKYLHNDYVRVVAGQHCGERGSVVSIVTFEPASYIVEAESGKDIEVNEHDIEIVNS